MNLCLSLALLSIVIKSYGIENKDNHKVNEGRGHKMELEHVQLEPLLENFILDELEKKLNELEDIKVDAKILERHLDKHSNFSEYQETKRTLTSIENDMIKTYQTELTLLKRKIIASNHDLGNQDMDMQEVNRVLDKAEVTVENSRDIINSFIENHLESADHQHEHDHADHDGHDGHDHDDFADYSDLITNSSEATQDEERIMMETIDQELEDLSSIEMYKEDLNQHMQEHVKLNVEDDQLSRAVLDQVSSGDIQRYKKTLIDMRKRIKEANGHLKMEFVDKVVSMLDRVNIFVEINKERLETADQLDLQHDIKEVVKGFDETRDQVVEDVEEFQEPTITHGQEVQEEQSPSQENIVHDETKTENSKVPDEARQAFKESAEKAHTFLHDQNLIHHDEAVYDEDRFSDVEQVEDSLGQFVSINTCMFLGIICMVLIIIVIVVTRHRTFSDCSEKSDKFHEIGGITSPPPDDRTLYNPNNMFDTPKVSKVREDKSVSQSVKGGQCNYGYEAAEPYKRK